MPTVVNLSVMNTHTASRSTLAVRWFTLFIVAALLGGCATQDIHLSKISPLNPSVHSGLGRLGVVVATEQVRTGYDAPKGRSGYGAEGAHKGMLSVIEATLGNGDGRGGILLPALLPLGALVGATLEVSKRTPPTRLTELERDVQTALAETQHADELRAMILREVGARSYGTIQAETQSHRDAAVQPDSILEIDLEEVGLRRTGKTDATFALFVTVHARLRDTRSGRVLAETPIQYRSGSCLFYDWALVRADGVRTQLKCAYRAIAESLIKGWFEDRVTNSGQPLLASNCF